MNRSHFCVPMIRRKIVSPRCLAYLPAGHKLARAQALRQPGPCYTAHVRIVMADRLHG